MHAGELVPDRADQQRGDDGGVHAAGEREQDLLVADLFTQRPDLLGDKGLGELRGRDADHVVGASYIDHRFTVPF